MDKNEVLIQRLIEKLPTFQTHDEIYAAFPDGCPIMFRRAEALSTWYPGKVRGVVPGTSLVRFGTWDLLVETEQKPAGLHPNYNYSFVVVSLIMNTAWHTGKLTPDHVAVKYADSVIDGLKLCVYAENERKIYNIDPSVFIFNGVKVDSTKVISLVQQLNTNE